MIPVIAIVLAGGALATATLFVQQRRQPRTLMDLHGGERRGGHGASRSAQNPPAEPPAPVHGAGPYSGAGATPADPNGKLDRKALPAPGGARPELEADFVTPRTPTEELLAGIWAEVLGVERVGVYGHFFELGGHSLLAVRLMAQIEQQFQKKLPLSLLFQQPTIAALAKTLAGQFTDGLWSPVVSLQTGGNRLPLFLAPGAGGTPVYFYGLSRHFHPDQPVYALESAGLDGEAPPYTTIETMADYFIQAIQEVQERGPYLLMGHSSGGRVVFEMAQQLMQQGQEIGLLAILDTTAPTTEPKPVWRSWDETQYLLTYAQMWEPTLGQEIDLSPEALRSLTPEGQLEAFKTALEKVNLLPPDIGISRVRCMLDVFKADLKMFAAYVSQTLTPLPIMLFLAEGSSIENDGGWGAFGPTEVHVVPGDHFTMLSEPHVVALAEKLEAYLSQIQPSQ
jgi:thioesterase domain-containing protein/acyl carrier protein